MMRDDLEIPYPSMATSESTAYTPRDYRGTAGIDSNTRRMAIIAGAIGGVLLLIMGVWSVVGHKRAGVPVIEADSRPVRERPLNKGGLAVTGADETILSGDTEGKAVVAPSPEAPAIRALKATPPATVAAAPPEAPVAPPVAAVPAAPAPRVAAESVRPVAPPPVAQAATATIRSATPAASAGKAQVQLAALGSESAAMSEWQRLSHKYPELLSSRHPAVSRTERDGKQFWRLRVSGFNDTASATSFCEQLRAKGGACALASF